MRKLFKSRRRKVIAATLAIAAIGAGSALAAWVISGSGSAGGRAGSAQALVVTQTDPTAGLLYPGGSGDVAFHVTNPNGFPVTVTGADFSGVTSTDCDASTVTVDPSATLSATIPANGSTTVEVPGVLHATDDLANACQGASFDVGVSLTAASGS